MGRKPGAMFGDTHTIRLYLNEYRGELGVRGTGLGETSCYVLLCIMDFDHVDGQPIQNGTKKFKNK